MILRVRDIGTDLFQDHAGAFRRAFIEQTIAENRQGSAPVGGMPAAGDDDAGRQVDQRIVIHQALAHLHQRTIEGGIVIGLGEGDNGRIARLIGLLESGMAEFPASRHSLGKWIHRCHGQQPFAVDRGI